MVNIANGSQWQEEYVEFEDPFQLPAGSKVVTNFFRAIVVAAIRKRIEARASEDQLMVEASSPTRGIPNAISAQNATKAGISFVQEKPPANTEGYPDLTEVERIAYLAFCIEHGDKLQELGLTVEQFVSSK